MAGTFQFTCSNYVTDSRRCFSSSAVLTRTTARLTCSSCLDHKLNGRLKCAPNSRSLVCRASSGGYRRNPDFSRLNKHGYRGRHSEGRDDFDVENSEMLSSRNGSSLSLSNSPKFQATSSPGPREKEIVELFRKVQAQLRARAAAKREDKKVEEEEEEASKGQGKENETVDSLLKLLRKHSGEQSKKANNFSSQEDNSYPLQGEHVDRQDHSGDFVKSWNRNNNASSSFTRPTSSFRRRSPVPRSKSPPTYSSEAIFDQESSYSVTWTSKKDTSELHDEPEDEVQAEPEIVSEYDEHEPDFESEPDPVTAILEPESELQLDSYQEEEEDVTLDVLSDDDESLDEEVDDEAEEEAVEEEDLSTLKLMELRGIAKSRGLKGFSKMKKAELVELLSSKSS